MKELADIKNKLHTALLQRINTQIDTINKSIQSIHESKSNETKSSAGDKFETGRAMLHLEQDQLESQLRNANQLRGKLKTLKSIPALEKIEEGSLVLTDNGTYYISIGVGKMKFEEKIYLVISSDSPIGKQLVGKSKNDIVAFNGRKIKILEIA